MSVRVLIPLRNGRAKVARMLEQRVQLRVWAIQGDITGRLHGWPPVWMTLDYRRHRRTARRLARNLARKSGERTRTVRMTVRVGIDFASTIGY